MTCHSSQIINPCVNNSNTGVFIFFIVFVCVLLFFSYIKLSKVKSENIDLRSENRDFYISYTDRESLIKDLNREIKELKKINS